MDIAAKAKELAEKAKVVAGNAWEKAKDVAGDVAETFERFLPENDHRWTPDELEVGAHAGPWMSFDGAQLDA